MINYKKFCEQHGEHEEDDTKIYWVEKGLNYGYLRMCEKAALDREFNGWKIKEKLIKKIKNWRIG